MKVKGIDEAAVKMIKDIADAAFSEKGSVNKKPPPKPMEKPVPEYNDYDGEEIFVVRIGKKFIGKNVKDLLEIGFEGLSYLNYLLNMTQMDDKDLCWRSVLKLTPEFTEQWELCYINEPQIILKELCKLYDTIPGQKKISPSIVKKLGYNTISDLIVQGSQSDLVITMEALLNAVKNTCEELR